MTSRVPESASLAVPVTVTGPASTSWLRVGDAIAMNGAVRSILTCTVVAAVAPASFVACPGTSHSPSWERRTGSGQVMVPAPAHVNDTVTPAVFQPA